MRYLDPQTGEVFDTATGTIAPGVKGVTPAIDKGMHDAMSDMPPPPSLHRYSPTEGISPLENFLAGAGRSVYETGRGLGQLAGIIPQSQIDEARRLDAPLMESTAGQLGNVAGAVGQMASPGLLLKGAGVLPGVARTILNPRTATQAAAAGGLFSAAQPVVEGESRGLNAALGAAGGAAGQMAGRYIAQGVKGVSPYMKQVADKARRLGAKVTPAAETGNTALRQVESSFASNPLTSNRFADIKANNQEVLNKVAARAMGEDGTEITEHVLGRADKRIKAVFNRVFRGKTLPMPKTTLGEIEDISAAYLHSPTGRGDATFGHITDYLNEELAGGTITGKQYLAIHNELQKTIRSAWRGENSNPELARATQDILDVLDSQAAKGLTKPERAAYAKARTQWGNKTKIEATLNGQHVSGPKLANMLKKKDKGGFLRGGGRADRATQDLYDMARFADVYRGIVGDSGTATRLSMPQLVGSEVTHTGIGGLLAHALGVDPLTGMAAGAVAAPAMMKGAQSAYLSAPARAALTYGGLPPGLLSSAIQGGVPKVATEVITPEARPPRRR